MQVVRCGQCSKKLAEAVYTFLSIKCPRCRTLNHLKATELPISATRSPDNGSTHDETYSATPIGKERL
jgi:phage FluMu protein Com